MSTKSVNGVQYNTDEDGFPIMPEELRPFEAMKVAGSEEGDALAKRLGREAFQIWKSNGFQHVKFFPEQSTPCISSDPKLADTFIMDQPSKEDYPDAHSLEVAWREFDISVAKAKSLCAECPLQMQCLTSSITQPVRDRSRDIDPDRVGYDPYNIWGGFGVSGRSIIWDEMVDNWKHWWEETSGAVSDDAEPQLREVDRKRKLVQLKKDRDQHRAKMFLIAEQNARMRDVPGYVPEEVDPRPTSKLFSPENY